MSASTTLTVYPRDIIGKANRRLAGANRIPAVVYGMGRDSLAVAVDRHDFEMLMGHHAAGSMLVEMQIEGEKKPIHAMIREMQIGPVKGNIIHVDFLAVSMDELVHAVVAVRLVNDPEGVKAGGVLTVDRHDINISAKPGDLPDSIDFDVSALEIGDTVHVSDLVLPKGVTVLDGPEELIASVTPPTVAVEAEESVEATEPERVGEKSAE